MHRYIAQDGRQPHCVDDLRNSYTHNDALRRGDVFCVVCDVEVSVLWPTNMLDVMACTGRFAEGGLRPHEEDPVVGVAVCGMREGGVARREGDV